jgi:hypothetical protein
MVGHSDNVSDEETKKIVAGFRSKAGTLANSVGSRVIRFAATTGIGFLNPAAGLVAGAIDAFLVDRVLPKSGVVAFLTETYPSLFTSP